MFPEAITTKIRHATIIVNIGNLTWRFIEDAESWQIHLQPESATFKGRLDLDIETIPVVSEEGP